MTTPLSETVPHGNREPTSVQLFFQQQTEEYLDPGKDKTNLKYLDQGKNDKEKCEI